MAPPLKLQTPAAQHLLVKQRGKTQTAVLLGERHSDAFGLKPSMMSFL